jgi:organic radical activating enzyme
MNLPDKELYTEKELAERWGTTIDKINQQVKAGKLKRYGKPKIVNVPLQQLPYEFNGPALELYYMREDIERFEKEHERKAIKANEPIKQSVETDKQLYDRLKLEGQTDKEIAKELKRVFPEIHPSRIGRLITEIPGTHVETDAYRKRGIRLLK